MRNIPQCDPKASYLADRAAIDAALARALAGGRYILGPDVEAFEREFASYTGAAHAVGVANGTDALALALRAVGIGSGDVVATVSHTAVATVVAIRATGATPLFVDVDPSHGLIDTEKLAETLELARSGRLDITPDAVKAVVPVHLYGRCAEMPAIMELAAKHGLAVVEDCAQAHGARLLGRQAGTWGDCGSFSFYPTKNLGALGDGGALVCSRPDLLERIRLLREYGWRTRYVSEIEGCNSRLDELQAAILRVKLSRLDVDNLRRETLAGIYRSRLNNPAVVPSPDASPGVHVYHQFTVRCRERDSLRRWLADHGIGSLVHYPVPIHLQPAYTSPRYVALPLAETERWASEVLSLPMYPELSGQDAERVADAVNSWAP